MWQLGSIHLTSRLLLGTARYPSLDVMQEALLASGTQIITLSLKRERIGTDTPSFFWKSLQTMHCHLLPNTAGCTRAYDAVETAKIARDLFQTHWIKLEVIGDDYTLHPDPFELVQAAKILVQEGFEVFPYCTEDLVLCQRLVDSGCTILMPWAAPIGSGKGILHPEGLARLRARFPDTTLIIDAGIGKPSHAAHIMELGFDGVLLNTAVALAQNPIQMAKAFQNAVLAGRMAWEAGMLPPQAASAAVPSTPLIDTPFWHQRK